MSNQNKFMVTTQYNFRIDSPIELPDGKTWSDVQECWVKWHTLYLLFEDGSETEIGLSYADDDADCDNYKWPTDVTIRPMDEDGGLDWDVVPVAEYSEPDRAILSD